LIFPFHLRSIDLRLTSGNKSARRGPRTTHSRLFRRRSILHDVLPDHRERQRISIPRNGQATRCLRGRRPRNPRRHPREDEHIHRAGANCLLWRINQERWRRVCRLRVDLRCHAGERNRGHAVDDRCSHDTLHFYCTGGHDQRVVGRRGKLRCQVWAMWRPGMDRRHVLSIGKHLLRYQPGNYPPSLMVVSS
jgi:hypothetical protein